MLSNDEIENRFGFHKATIEGPEATKPVHSQLRRAFKAWAHELNATLPDGREKTFALTHLEEASMWAHKSVARDAPLVDERGVKRFTNG